MGIEMKKVRIVGLTRKGKNRVQEHGDVWFIEREQDFDTLLRAKDGYLKWVRPGMGAMNDFKIVEEIQD